MTNTEIYKKTLGFSVRRMLWDILAVLGAVVLTGAAFWIAEKTSDKGLIGLAVGGVIALIGLWYVLRFMSYTYKAGQIAMMTRAVSGEDLPEDVIGEGKKVVRERFATVALFFAATRVIRGIFSQIGRAITSIGEKVGGDTGNTIASAISTAIQVVVAYLCDCCLGWVFYRKEIKAGKATCEGAVLFFRHGKTLARNMGRVFGMGLASLALIGGTFTLIFHAVAAGFPDLFARLAAEFASGSAAAESSVQAYLSDPASLMWISAGIGGLIVWLIIHSVFIRPFVLVGVLRNYIDSGMRDIPDESSFSVLDGKSDKFRKLHAEAA